MRTKSAPAARKTRTAVPAVTNRTSVPPVAAGARRYLNRHEAAAYLGVSVEKLKVVIRAGLIAEYQFGPRFRRYLPEDLDAYAATARVGVLRKKNALL